MREEVSKGVRFGSMILAAMVAGVAGYRFVHTAHAAPPPPEIARPAPPAAPIPAPAPDPAPAPISGAVGSKDTTVPPPPAPGAHRNRPAAPRATPAPVAEAIVTPVETPAVPEEKPVAPATPAAREEKPVAATEVIAPQSAPASAEQADDPKAPPRGKRVLKAVGHFLHIGKKDADPQSPKQQ